MKKLICTILIVGIASMCSCSKERDVSNPTDAIYVDTIVNTYGTGRIYGKDPVKYIDYETMDTSVLCTKPNCKHLTSDCIGKIVGECPIIYNDYIYYFKYNHKVEETNKGTRELKIDSKLCRISSKTSQEEIIAKFTDCEPCDYNGWMIYNDVAYFAADDLNPAKDEYGAISVSNIGGTHYFCSIDLKTKKYKNYGSIYDGDKQFEGSNYSSSAKIAGMYEGKIYIDYSYAENIDIINDTGYPDFTDIMFEFSPKSDIIVQVDLPKPINFMNNGIYIYNSNDTTVVLDHGEKKEVNINSGLFASCFNNKLFVRDKGIWIDLSDMSEHSMGEYSYDYQVIDYYNNCYILIRHTSTVKLTEEELLSLDKEK